MSWSTVTALIVALSSLIVVINGDYKLEVFLDHYQNPTHTLADGGCCDRHHYSSCGRTSCDNFFLFCVRPYGSPTSLTPLCPGRNYTTGIIHHDDVSFEGKKYVDQENRVPNPLVFAGKTWPGSFQLFVLVADWDIFDSKLVDHFISDWKLSVSTNYSGQMNIPGFSGSVTLRARARVTCTNGYFGLNCSYFCNQGSESCNIRDICSELTPCLNGATCLNTNTSGRNYYKCVCTRRFTGKNCSKMVNESLNNNTTSTTTSNGGVVSSIVGPTIVSIGDIRPQVGGRSGVLVGTLVGGLVTIVLLILAIIFMAICIWCKRRPSEEETKLTKEAKTEYGGPLDNPTYVTAQNSEGSDYRRLDNPLYDTHKNNGSKASSATYETFSESPSHKQDPTTGAPLPRFSQYSVIIRHDSDISSSHTYSDVDEDDENEQPTTLESQYSLVTHERAQDQDTQAPIESAYSSVTRNGNNNTQVPIESQYSVVTRTGTHNTKTEPVYSNVTHNRGDRAPIESGYSVITQSNLGHDVEEASDSDTDDEEDSQRRLLS